MKIISSVILLILIKCGTSIELKCTFIKTDLHYGCQSTANLVVIYSNNISDRIVDTVTGNHIKGFSNENVTALNFTDGKISFFPRNLEKFFPSVTNMLVENKKFHDIGKDDIGQFKNLARMKVISDSIYRLSGDVFENNRNISVIWIEGGRDFQGVHPKLIENLSQKKQITIMGRIAFNRWTPEKSIETFWDQSASSFPYPKTAYCIYQVKFDENYYSCVVQKMIALKYNNETIQTEDEKLLMQSEIEIFGIHKSSNTDKDVFEIDIKSSDTAYFPICFGIKFKNLKVVRINAQLKNLGTLELQNFTNVEELYLAQNQIATIFSDAFLLLKNLRTIDLKGNKITKIGIGAFWIPEKLTNLDIGKYECSEFVGTTRARIEKFVISQRNSRCTVQDGLYCQYQRMTLSFVGNVYTCLGNNSDNYLKPMEKFDTVAFGHHIEGLTNGNVEAVKIQNYLLYKNVTFDFHRSFCNLKYLQIYNSSLTGLKNDVLSKLLDLRVIDLSFNLIKFLHPYYFEKNKALISVNLEGNLINFVSSDIFINNQYLEFAYFERNVCVDNNAIFDDEINELKSFFIYNCDGK